MVVLTTLMPTHKHVLRIVVWPGKLDLRFDRILFRVKHSSEWLKRAFVGKKALYRVSKFCGNTLRKIKDCLSSSIFPSEGGSAKSSL